MGCASAWTRSAIFAASTRGSIQPASDAQLLRHFLEVKGVTPAQVSREAGIAKSTVSEVLAGKRPFSRQMIRKLADYFHVHVSGLAVNI